MSRPNVRSALLDAALQHVGAHGLATLTLDAVAAAAGVSKGGLLYHFPTKAALVSSLVDHALEAWEHDVDLSVAATPGPGAWAHAYVDASLDHDASRPDATVTSLVAPHVGPEVIERCAQRFGAWEDRLLADGLTTSTASLVRFACDGWWTYAGFASPAIDPERRDALRSRLHDLIDAEVGS